MTGSPSVSSEATSNNEEGAMIRVLTILAAVVALAVSAAPASAGLLSSPLGTSARANSDVANHTEGTVSVKSFTVDMAGEKLQYLGTPDAPFFG
jgi:hypothetical protein